MNYVQTSFEIFQVLRAATMEITNFRDTALCSFVKVYRRFRGAYTILMMEAVRISEKSVYFKEIADPRSLSFSTFQRVKFWFRKEQL
jgi:hypothetical protein